MRRISDFDVVEFWLFHSTVELGDTVGVIGFETHGTEKMLACSSMLYSFIFFGSLGWGSLEMDWYRPMLGIFYHYFVVWLALIFLITSQK